MTLNPKFIVDFIYFGNLARDRSKISKFIFKLGF